MFRFIHISDLHFGRLKHSSVDASTGLQTSLVNDMEVFHEAISLAEKEKVDAVLLAGDIFDKIHVSNAVRKEVAKAFRRILDSMHLYAIVGTHDRAHDRHAAHTLSDWMNLAGGTEDHMSRLHIFEQADVVEHVSSTGTVLAQLIAIPEPTKGILEGKSYVDYVKRHFSSVKLRKDIPVVVVAHMTVSGAKVGDETKDFASFRPKESVPVEFFDDLKQVDYVALGHIHQTQELGRTGKVVYPGSLNYCSFAEVNQQKGVYLIEISTDKILKKQFLPLKTPTPLLELKIDVRGESSPMKTVKAKIKEFDTPGSILKVVVAMHESQMSMVTEKDIIKSIKRASSASVSRNIDREIKMRDATLTYDLEVREAYERFLSLGSMPDETRTSMLASFDEVLTKYNQSKTKDV